MERQAGYRQIEGSHLSGKMYGGRTRRTVYLLAIAVSATLGAIALDIRSREVRLEAGGTAPATSYLPENVPAPEPPIPAPAPAETLAPEGPSISWPPGGSGVPSSTGELPGGKNSPTYVGPVAPEFTGSPAPASSGLMDGVLFQHPVLGIHPALMSRLQQVEAPGAPPALGVEMIVGYRRGSRAHANGLAVDINYYANPYLMHEGGESERDAGLALVYHRIARTMLGRDSVIPEEITTGSPGPERTLRLYRQLCEESRAMIAYFRLMQDSEALGRFAAAQNPPPNVADLRRQMADDYVTLSGRPGPVAPGLKYPEALPAPGDPPFAGDPVYRGPELGFLNLKETLVRELTDAGLRWGGTDMGANSGDLMHFYLPDSEVR